MTIWRATRRGDTIMIAIEGVSHVTFAQESCKHVHACRRIAGSRRKQ